MNGEENWRKIELAFANVSMGARRVDLELQSCIVKVYRVGKNIRIDFCMKDDQPLAAPAGGTRSGE